MYWMVESQPALKAAKTVKQCYANKADAIEAGKSQTCYRATVWEYRDDGTRLFILRKIRG